jgi:hypothetical protein
MSSACCVVASCQPPTLIRDGVSHQQHLSPTTNTIASTSQCNVRSTCQPCNSYYSSLAAGKAAAAITSNNTTITSPPPPMPQQVKPSSGALHGGSLGPSGRSPPLCFTLVTDERRRTVLHWTCSHNLTTFLVELPFQHN